MENMKQTASVKSFHSTEVKSSAFSIGFEKLDRGLFDPEKAYIQGAKLLAMDAVKLLENNAALGNMIASIKPFMTKEEYINYKELFCSTEEFNYDQA